MLSTYLRCDHCDQVDAAVKLMINLSAIKLMRANSFAIKFMPDAINFSAIKFGA